MAKEVINDVVKTIPTTADVVSEAVFNGQRKVIVLTNTSVLGEVISVAINAEAKDGEGIVLQPLDRYVESLDAGFLPSNARITAIATAATATLAIHEVIELEE
jgi:hypothetical protein